MIPSSGTPARCTATWRSATSPPGRRGSATGSSSSRTAVGVDGNATESERARLRADRVVAPVTVSNEPDLDGPRRRIGLPAALAHRLEVESGALVEVATPACGAALRGWARIVERPDLALSTDALAALGAHAGDAVEVRAVRTVPR